MVKSIRPIHPSARNSITKGGQAVERVPVWSLPTEIFTMVGLAVRARICHRRHSPDFAGRIGANEAPEVVPRDLCCFLSSSGSSPMYAFVAVVDWRRACQWINFINRMRPIISSTTSPAKEWLNGMYLLHTVGPT